MGCNKLVWLGLMDIHILQKLGRNAKADTPNDLILNIKKSSIDIEDKDAKAIKQETE
jgi:predicted lysophospholipase L1 biosynthesis ABC-type transport system permease subunit|tara:strand:- start:280 stop:450 length:171 start_codon:yes stop_codon:yes gene_type:complete